jgi:hypothetical protein
VRLLLIIANLSLRSFYHGLLSAFLWLLFNSLFGISAARFSVMAGLFKIVDELREYHAKEDNSFDNLFVFKRDLSLAMLGALFLIAKFYIADSIWLYITAPAILILCSEVIDKFFKPEFKKRNLIKPLFDVVSVAIGPLLMQQV